MVPSTLLLLPLPYFRRKKKTNKNRKTIDMKWAFDRFECAAVRFLLSVLAFSIFSPFARHHNVYAERAHVSVYHYLLCHWTSETVKNRQQHHVFRACDALNFIIIDKSCDIIVSTVRRCVVSSVYVSPQPATQSHWKIVNEHTRPLSPNHPHWHPSHTHTHTNTNFT